MPLAEQFENIGHYHATLLHEAVHWSGHKDRLARLDMKNRFGDAGYAVEELVAEIGSAFLCANFQIPLEGLRHADYLANWLAVLKADKRAIFTACTAAQKAADYLLAGTAQTVETEVADAA